MAIDYIGTFFTDEGFDFTGLLNADFFEPIRILFRAEHYVSATKLLVVAIDSVAYVEFGDGERNPFVAWLHRYANLGPIGVTPEELWEQRNSLLHMSNLDSRKVKKGEIRRLVAYVGGTSLDVPRSSDTMGYFNLQHLIVEFGHACGRWCDTYDKDRAKIYQFVERYDLIASDARMMKVRV